MSGTQQSIQGFFAKRGSGQEREEGGGKQGMGEQAQAVDMLDSHEGSEVQEGSDDVQVGSEEAQEGGEGGSAAAIYCEACATLASGCGCERT